ncbi:MAG: nickel-dependent lactate racemase [Thermoleophilia bacterium]|nr:nickel-dependent lactate racemase [Thermoleophilia bacterium]
MRIDVPWGTGTTPVDVDTRRVAGVLGANVEKAADSEGILREALTHAGRGFQEFLALAASPLLVVVNDGTRPTPSAEVLAVLGTDLEEWLRTPGNELSLAVATGTHRAVLPEELDRIFGAEFAATHAKRIFSHDSKDEENLVHLGRTSRGTEVWVNRELAEARSVFVINSVEPHYFAGYTGGRKSLFPGLAGYETVWANHKLSMDEGSELLVLDGNPVHEDLEESLALGIAGKDIYSIQLVLDKEHRIGFAAAGSLRDTFRQAVEVADRQFVLDIDRRYEVVVAVAPHPMDCNLYQTNKAIQSGALAVKDGGVLIVVSRCTFGLGENQTLFDMLAAADSPAHALERAELEEYKLGVQQATRIAAILERARIWMVSSLQDEQVGAMFMTPFASVQEALDAALADQGDAARALFLTEASITVPRVRRAGQEPG